MAEIGRRIVVSDSRSSNRSDGRMMEPVTATSTPNRTAETTVLDADRCYLAARSRDARFDGWFYVAVRTTGIYCRPSCPAVTPKRENVEFHRTAAAAQHLGFRACKRCRPDAAPGSPEWNLRGDLVARAVRLIGDGVVDRDGVGGLARRLGYSERHLHRLLSDELGAGPLALARAQRAQTARTLIETTELTMTEIAFAAGFGSVRQFNDTVREVFAASPTELRHRRSPSPGAEPGAVAVRLPVRTPFAGRELFDFVGAHAIPGLESYDGTTLARTLDLPHGHGVVRAVPADDHVAATFRLADWRDLAPAVDRVRRWLDLDADPVAIDEALGDDPLLAASIAELPGLRSPASVDPFEAAIRTVVGQQVSIAGASSVTGRIVAELGAPLAIDDPELDRVFPTADVLAAVDPNDLPLPRRRGATIARVAAAVRAGDLDLAPGADRADARASLLALTGIGPWSADHVAMRGFGDPDVFLAGDLVVRRALEHLDLPPEHAERWRPWRSYATRHLWRTVWRPR